MIVLHIQLYSTIKPLKREIFDTMLQVNTSLEGHNYFKIYQRDVFLKKLW